MSENVSVEYTQDGIVNVSIYGKNSLNIMSRSLAQNLTGKMTTLAQEADIRAVVFRGGGERSFIGGADIKEMSGFTASQARDFITSLREMLESVRRLPVPTIAAINGWCLGVGLELAAVCDIRLAVDDSQFGMPEVLLGMPSVLHASVLHTVLGEGRTRWLLLTGRRVGAHKMADWGFLQEVMSKGDLDEEISRVTSDILACSQSGVRLQKGLLNHWLETRVDLCLDHSTKVFGQAFEGPEPQEYIHRFLQQANTRKN